MSRAAKRVRLSPSEDELDESRMRKHVTQGQQDSSRDDISSEDEDEDEDEDEEAEDDGQGSEEEENDEDDDDDSEPDEHAAPHRDPVRDQLRQISFGALLDAQSTLPTPAVSNHRHQISTSTDSAAKVNLLRERLAELKALKKNSNKPDSSDASTSTSKPSKHSSSHSSSSTQRSHKHAPMEQSSKYQVSRKRAAITTSSNPYNARDPRFSAVSGTPAAPSTVRKNYAFLAEYGASELAELKAAVKSTKSAEDKDALRREIVVRESRIKAEESKERERRVVAAHRKEEKEAVAQGKKPFFLKRDEIRKRVLVDKFESMKGKERERAMTRRRKKESQRGEESHAGG